MCLTEPRLPPAEIVLTSINERGSSVSTTQKVFLEQSNWISEPPKEGKKYLARIRHRGELYPCQLKINQSKVEVVFLKPPLAPAAGQSLVIYESGRVLGGGVIA
jgi:tRNA U34 2-thiouridine synthase MnmA/TrmU